MHPTQIGPDVLLCRLTIGYNLKRRLVFTHMIIMFTPSSDSRYNFWRKRVCQNLVSERSLRSTRKCLENSKFRRFWAQSTRSWLENPPCSNAKHENMTLEYQNLLFSSAKHDIMIQVFEHCVYITYIDHYLTTWFRFDRGYECCCDGCCELDAFSA